MLIINKYLTEKYLRIFLLVFVTLTILIWLTQIVSIIEFLAFKGLGFTRFISFSVLLIPEVVSMILPFVGIISSVVLALELVSKREVSVLKASGLSVKSICLPIQRVALLVLFFGLVMHFYILPKSYTQYETTKDNIRNSNLSFSLRKNSIMQISKEMVIYNAEDENGNNNLILYRVHEEEEEIVFAEKGDLLKFNEEILFNLENGGSYHRKKGDENFSVIGFKQFVSDLKIKEKVVASLSAKDKLKGLTIFDFFVPSALEEFSRAQLLAEVFHRISWAFLGFLMPILVFNLCLAGEFNRIHGIKKQILYNVLISLSVFALHFVIKHNFGKFAYIETVISLFAILLFFLWKIDIENNFIFSKRQPNNRNN